MLRDQTDSTHGLRDYYEKSRMQINFSLQTICNEFLQDNSLLIVLIAEKCCNYEGERANKERPDLGHGCFINRSTKYVFT